MTNSHQKSLSALATIGAYWVLTNNGPCSMHPRLRRRDDGRWVCPEFAEGLAPAEAFGLTLAVRWAELDERGEAVQLVHHARRAARRRPALIGDHHAQPVHAGW